MSFNIEGALAGAGEGIVKSAGFLEAKYARDFETQKSNLEFARKTHLESLRESNNLSLAKTQRGWGKEDSADKLEADREDSTTAFNRQKELMDYKNKGALDLATQKSKREEGKNKLETMKLQSEIRENLASAAKTLQETENLKNKPTEMNSKLIELANSAVMSQEGTEGLSIGELMAQTGQAYKVAFENSGGTATLTPTDYSKALTVYQAAMSGNAEAVKDLKLIVDSGEVPQSVFQSAEKATGVSVSSLLQSKPKGNKVAGQSALDVSMSGPIGSAVDSTKAPNGVGQYEWNNARKTVIKGNGGSWNSTEEGLIKATTDRLKKDYPNKY